MRRKSLDKAARNRKGTFCYNRTTDHSQRHRRRNLLASFIKNSVNVRETIGSRFLFLLPLPSPLPLSSPFLSFFLSSSYFIPFVLICYLLISFCLVLLLLCHNSVSPLLYYSTKKKLPCRHRLTFFKPLNFANTRTHVDPNAVLIFRHR